MKDPQRLFWMVKGDGPTSTHHNTRDAAEREAERLARNNPDQVFYVLETVAAFRKVDVERIDFGMPF